MKAFHLQELSTCLSIVAKHYGMQDDANCYHGSNVCSYFKTTQSCVIKRMTLHCGLPAGKLKFARILVQQVIEGTSHMHE